MHHLVEIAQRASLPSGEAYFDLIEEAARVLRLEDPLYRPRDEEEKPGGLLRLDDRPAIIVPDLHGRMWFLLNVLAYRPGERVRQAPGSSHEEEPGPSAGPANEPSAEPPPPQEEPGPSVAELLVRGEVQIVCVGDGFHAESRAVQRWKRAFKEFSGKFRRHAAMDEEMRESLGLMEMIMHLKIMRPDGFHFLKGNHENILNEEGRGNHPFRKFAYEGEMVKEWVLHFYGQEFLNAFAELEHELPLVAADRTFMVSHAEPQRFFSHEEVIGYRKLDEVVLGLTWTPNDGAEEGSVDRMIAEYCSDPGRARYFGGHRPVSGRYGLRAGDRYVQLHNPGACAVAVLRPGEEPDPGRDIVELPAGEEEVLRAAESW